MTAATTVLPVPQLGPSLGRVVTGRSPGRDEVAHWFPLADLRVAMVHRIFEAEAEARSWSDTGDRAAAIDALGREVWVTAWERAAHAAAERATDEVARRLRLAALESRMPRRLLERILPTAEEVHVTATRFGSGGAEFIEALDDLEAAGTAVKQAPSASAAAAWGEALLRVARRLEAAWIALEAATAREWSIWAPEVEAARRWQRARLPLWLITGAVIVLAAWLGLVLGGFLPYPGWFAPVVNGFWRLAGGG